MSFTLEPLEPKEASKEDPKEAEVTPLFSKDLADFPGKEGLMIHGGVSSGQHRPYTSPQRTSVCLCP
jgi:hypothetical protein